ncbi:MAG: DUF4376 domain-containing protein [Rhizobiaceae bacterium]|nr:DUF4376 domain-containing protein [Rhizobiaceae bacterium]
MKFATFDTSGNPTTFYAEDVHGERLRPVYGEADPETGIAPVIGEEPNPDCLIPAGAVAITDAHWLELLTYPGQRRWDGAAVVVYTPPPEPITGDDVNRERARRIVAGKVIDGVYVTGRDEDARNLTNLMLGAQLRITAGDTTPTTYRDGNNVDHVLSPEQIVLLWQQSAAYVSALYAASWALKALDPIPADYTADQYWPTV